ncbi:hypothetical protein [Sphaerospermopsis aphanizomenoides]|uniref:hypothetical protein n=1 Tax=Sphaerospermopsis aphanizomenoides TaxID=459663 RepID=UPI0019085313|nr:hypothetical protein [Sphaerospermopsis aphanizomenoides]
MASYFLHLFNSRFGVFYENVWHWIDLQSQNIALFTRLWMDSTLKWILKTLLNPLNFVSYPAGSRVYAFFAVDSYQALDQLPDLQLLMVFFFLADC